MNLNKRRNAAQNQTNSNSVPSRLTPQQVAARRERNRRKRQRRNERYRELVWGESSGTAALENLPPVLRRGGKAQSNPADPRDKLSLRQLGNTPDGVRFALGTLHPCGEGFEDVAKVPDGAVSSSVALQRRSEFGLVMPSVSATLAVDSWSCLVVSTPFVRKSQLAIAYLNVQTPSEDSLKDVLQQALSSDIIDATLWPIWQEATLPTGQRAWYTFMRDTVITDNLDLARQNYRSIRRIGCGLTIDFDANSLTNQGRVVAGQFSSDIVARVYANDAAGSFGEFWAYEIPAILTADIVQEDLKSVQFDGKEGIYMPMRKWQPTYDLAPSSSFYPSLVSVNGVYKAAGSNPGVAPYDLRDVYLIGWGFGVSHFFDMHPSTKLRVKKREMLELSVQPHSVYGPFISSAPCRDQRALDIVAEESRILPTAFPAEYNFLGKILKDIVGSLGGIIKDLNLPVISDLAPFLGEQLGNFVEKVLPI